MPESEKKLLINKIISKFPNHFKEDLFNECYIELDSILKRFDPEKSNINTFSYKHLYFKCKHFINSLQINNESLDEIIFDEEGNGESKVNYLESVEDLQLRIETTDYILQHNKYLTEVERFIQDKYYKNRMSVKEIINVFYPYHLIKSKKTIYKILKK
ncbi:sigma-70 RNA polymerase sigma factor region 4 domain-containing protein [Cochleicola gelatinilyticus]|uniref:Uncharacterized protein n=1 Tax=Cochleicola gelatinilyticus TaxID=1763537 RepID=A0A167HMG1_9FLAO|nr:sigma-70 family RNA polymerase sigma factor [Cochleicola gelatinilyticus]OAB78770.1 hypothetical protein ULVI_09315 [Cochleicola gelatinilyticus]